MNKFKKTIYAGIAASMIILSTINVAAAKEDVSDTGLNGEAGFGAITLTGSYYYKPSNEGYYKLYSDYKRSNTRWKYNDSYIYLYVERIQRGNESSRRDQNKEVPASLHKVYVDTVAVDKQTGADFYCGYNKSRTVKRRRELKCGQYFLTNWAYETQGEGSVKLEFSNDSPYQMYINGKWSPDSRGSYTVL